MIRNKIQHLQICSYSTQPKKEREKKDIGVHLGTTYGASKKRETQKDQDSTYLSPEISGKSKKATEDKFILLIDWPHPLLFFLSTSESSRPVMFWAFGTQPSTVLIFAFYSVFTSCMQVDISTLSWFPVLHEFTTFVIGVSLSSCSLSDGIGDLE